MRVRALSAAPRPPPERHPPLTTPRIESSPTSSSTCPSLVAEQAQFPGPMPKSESRGPLQAALGSDDSRCKTPRSPLRHPTRPSPPPLPGACRSLRILRSWITEVRRTQANPKTVDVAVTYRATCVSPDTCIPSALLLVDISHDLSVDIFWAIDPERRTFVQQGQESVRLR